MKKQTLLKTKGMNRDLSVSAFNPEFSFENRNLRLSSNNGNTLLSWVNEKGTESITLQGGSINGCPIGTAIINHTLILFTTTNDTERSQDDNLGDAIYKIYWENGRLWRDLLYQGNLNFSTKNPLETLVSYESNNVQKVYWVDGRNQPRIINIAKSEDILSSTDTQFDFVPALELGERISIDKLDTSDGMFASGVIQYAFTYYNKNGQETNVFYVSSLRYISPQDRGGSPEEKVNNAFKIIIEGVDKHFQYLRIYSIQRTSVNGTPICRRVQDIDLSSLGDEESTVSFTDTGVTGDLIDPTELLYKARESITASTIEQKDNTLFLGNISISTPSVLTALINEGYWKEEDYKPNSTFVNLSASNRTLTAPNSTNTSSGYLYYNQLNFYDSYTQEGGIPCCGFKRGNTYRCGVQFQHKSGRWSEPCYIDDYKVPEQSIFIENIPNSPNTPYTLTIPTITGRLSSSLTNFIKELGYVKARAVVVYPEYQDRAVICQGVINPTVYTTNHRTKTMDLMAQSSWFFRPLKGSISDYGDSTSKTFSPISDGNQDIPYTKRRDTYNPNGDTGDSQQLYTNAREIRQVEIQGFFEADNRFRVGWDIVTFHSPDINFDEQLWNTNFEYTKWRAVGNVEFASTLSSINIQTSTPAIFRNADGFTGRTFQGSESKGIISGLFYEDYAVDDTSEGLGALSTQRSNYSWLVYPWQRSGSFNNDFNRPADKGIQSSLLKKKIISNLRYSNTILDTNIGDGVEFSYIPSLFSSEETALLKIHHDFESLPNYYYGNIDTVLYPDRVSPIFFAFDTDDTDYTKRDITTSFYSDTWWRLFKEANPEISKWDTTSLDWEFINSPIGDIYEELATSRDIVRMKYKSSPHLVFEYPTTLSLPNQGFTLPVFEIMKTVTSPFGGNSVESLKSNVWIPCGEPEFLGNSGEDDEETVFEYSYGDTYYQRWDCLKTYAFTQEDENQVVEIGSFMLETYVNIDGRYDRNRGQLNNLYMSPLNFNLINPVYSQKNNFFSYRLLDESYYRNTVLPNQVTWTSQKQNGADVDLWTNVTLASILELDGDKGEITKLERLDDKILCFQDSGISQILYNESVQVSTENGVPVEIANSGKVRGKRYLSDTIGCSNKWSMGHTPAGIYFIDSNDKSIYLLSENGLKNISQLGGFDAWCKQNISASDVEWTPDSFDNFRTVYDRINQDVMFINKNEALAWNEKIGIFTSFYDYGNTPYFNNIDDVGIWLKGTSAPDVVEEGEEQTYHWETSLWKHQGGDYCKFFGTIQPYSMILVGNPEPQTDKIFTNLEFRACVDGDGKYDESTNKFTPTLPFDSLEVWNEYQHGYTALKNSSGHNSMMHDGNSSSLKRRFRIWRCDIPRNNCLLDTDRPIPEPAYSYDRDLGISRYTSKPNDRMRNPWLYLKLQKGVESETHRTEIHDIAITYYN